MSVDIATPEVGSTTGGLTRNATLKSGQRFVLFDKESGKVLVAVGQNVVFQACDDMSVVHSMWHWHWDCVVAKGWVSLRNRISEYYLGPNYERLVVGPISGGFTGHLVVTGRGQTLSAPYGEYMFQIARGKTPQTLAMATTEGVEWEFIRVESQ
ncbi:hypothetical protein E4U30_000743 [Claviceps sp. LM220 group G6]|nr:hypothetical protein E4U30_000743 [Claviceps sp. LM220 group G6]